MSTTLRTDLGVEGAGGVGRTVVHGGVRDRHFGAGIGLEESTSLAEGQGSLDGRRLHVAAPGGARLVRVGARATPRATARGAHGVTLAGAAAPASTAAVPTLSLSEQTRPAQIGGWLFRHRGLLPIPLGLMAICIPGHVTAEAWGVGLAVMVLGEVLRLSGVAVAGPETRRRSRAVAHLVTYGPFAWVRNPLYVGNGLAWLGVAIISGVPWLIPLATSTFAVEYGLIVRYEEGVLESLFGQAYLAYKRRTSRWIPRRPGAGPRPVERRYDWPGAWRSESSTFASLAVVLAGLVIKTVLGG